MADLITIKNIKSFKIIVVRGDYLAEISYGGELHTFYLRVIGIITKLLLNNIFFNLEICAWGRPYFFTIVLEAYNILHSIA